MITRFIGVRRAAALGIVVAALAGAGGAAAQSQDAASPTGATGPVAAAPALSVEAEALRAALERRFGPESGVLAAYAERGFRPIWTGPGQDGAARLLTEALARAGEHALPAAKYGGAALAARLPGTGPALEADLAAAYLAYAGDLSAGLLHPRRVDGGIHTVPVRPEPLALLRGAGAATDMAAHLAGLAPQNPLYRGLLEHYAAFRSVAGDSIWGPPVDRGRTLRPGDHDQRVAQARARLVAMGDLDLKVYDFKMSGDGSDGTKLAANDVATDADTDATAPEFDAELFDEQMAAALRRFQERHGLNQDGVIGPATLAQLNVSPATRAEQIAVTLERLRWLNQDLGERHILVNIAGFTMTVMNQGRPEFFSRVIVGMARSDLRTPEFSDLMTHMIVNPSWHVPRSIATKEILPKLREDPEYLARSGMRIVGADEELIDWSTVTAENFPGRITQRPGRGNALGTVKFLFPNRFSIYLHDTPHKRLFGRDVRAFSHGCVRVERPHEFAAYLLAGQAEDPAAYFQEMLGRGGERRIDLENPVPVHLTYRTAWIDEAGVQQYRGDIYGRDGRIARALADAGVEVLQ